MCQVALPADFNILSHYVDNLDVCLAHSRRIQFGANAARQPAGEICKVNSKPVREKQISARVLLPGIGIGLVWGTWAWSWSPLNGDAYIKISRLWPGPVIH